MNHSYPQPLRYLIDRLCTIPSIGRKNAERIAFFFLYSKDNLMDDLKLSLDKVQSELDQCPECFVFIQKGELCDICHDSKRDRKKICVVENFKDIFLFEKTLEYNGLYHILEGKIAPLDGLTPEKLRIPELVERVQTLGIQEVIIATSLDTEGDATAFYISRLLREFSVSVTRLAKGLPFGVELEYADPITLATSLKNRETIL